MSNLSKLTAVALAIALAACADEPAPPPAVTTTATTRVDAIGPAEQPASLLVLAPTATAAARARLEATLARLGGDLYATLPPRLLIAQVPPGAERVLADLGVVARFDRAVTGADLVAPTLAEERFVAVHAARWFPAEVPPAARLAPTVRLRPDGEREGRFAPVAHLAREDGGGPAPDPEDTVAVPYASGTIVVSVILPESNGAVDASTEDWSEAMVRETYLKIVAGLDRIAASDRNADLRFVVHLESAPAAGGLEGTVDTVYEFGQRANWGTSNTEYLATADVLGKVVGRELTEGDVFPAATEYVADLKRRYQADGAFFVIVAANGNGTAGLRAHAFINGPWTVLDSGYGHETFAHEFGHIFGALDEYCPDACISPSAIQGYLGIYNANAQAQEGAGGIDDGRGEAAPSLMQYNQPGAINGYTRGAWGWLDTDGDGVIDVRDTAPESELTASVTGRTVRVTGTVVDRPATRVWSQPYSMNRVVALEYAFAAGGPWLRVALPGDTRGRQAVDVELGQVPAGARTVWLRAVSSVGNVEPSPVALAISATGAGNSAPHVRLDVPARAGDGSSLTVTATAVDLDGQAVTVRYDRDGNGTWDTAYGPLGAHTFTPVAGLRTVRAQFRDAAGATRIAEATVPVVSGPTPARIALGPVPSLVHGSALPRITASVAAPAGAVVSATAELATDDDVVQVPVTLAGGVLTADLPTPRSFRTRPIDLAAGDRELGRHDLRDLEVLGGDLVALAAGTGGVWIVDLADRAAPRVVARVELETTATRLLRAGNRLYVLGAYLAIVDLSNPRAPRELRPGGDVRDEVVGSAEEAAGISDADGGYAAHFVYTELGARIDRASVKVTIDHPRPADLVIRLLPDKRSGLDPIVLWDHRAAPGGRRTLTFAAPSNHALRALEGVFAEGAWTLEVEDDVANGLSGTLLTTRLELDTRSRATRVLDGASELPGVVGGQLVVAGRGVELLDVANPHHVRSLGRVAGTGTVSATLRGDIAIVGAPLEAKNPDGTLSTAPVRGLCAIDVTPSPRKLRCDPTIVVSEHAQLGDRLYVGSRPRCERDEECPAPVTIVGDAGRFAANQPWRRGTTPLRVDRWAFGDASTVWTINEQGSIDRLDVRDPAAIVLAERYGRTFTSRLVPLVSPEVLLFDFGAVARLARLDDAWSILSRVYRLTVTAVGAGGVEARVTRHVHVVPYDHAPTGAVLAIVPPRDGVGAPQLSIDVDDPDDLATWDPVRFARVDWEGDGAFDTDWLWIGSDGAGGFVTTVAIPAGGPRTAVVEVRDGFWARARATIVLP